MNFIANFADINILKVMLISVLKAKLNYTQANVKDWLKLGLKNNNLIENNEEDGKLLTRAQAHQRSYSDNKFIDIITTKVTRLFLYFFRNGILVFNST